MANLSHIEAGKASKTRRATPVLTAFIVVLSIIGFVDLPVDSLLPRLTSAALVGVPQQVPLVLQQEVAKPLAGLQDDSERSILRTHAKAHWTAGITAYRKHDMIAAAKHFQALLAQDLPACDRAAVAFWAYRALGASGDAEAALHHLSLAASEPPSFYSLLARSVMGNKTAPADNEAKATLYPIPQWVPARGYHVEPALVFAIIREESRFDPNARSSAGATGLMQLMPATAHAMARSAHVKGHASEPSVSMALGQSYLEKLMDMSSIGDNLIYLAAAYNAGPGSVASWQKHLQYGDDPLLFVESIPYGETREYVQRVIGNYWVYSDILGERHIPSKLALAKGQWPRYVESDAQLATIQNRLSGAVRIE